MTLKIYHQKRNFKKTPEPKGKVKTRKKIKNLYIIQKHAASHLHYDFRLELNGVLLSWAVPKGPSLDPTVKRLAMHVEDHPVEYGSFEGIIPKGQYGGGTVMLWDEGEWISEDKNPQAAYQKGNMTFTLKAVKLNGRWKLIRMNKNDKTWLLIKIKDEYARSQKSFDITKKEPNSVVSDQSIDEITENFQKVWGKHGLEKPIKSNKSKKKPKKIDIDLPKKPFPKIIHPQLATLVDKPPIGKTWLHEIKFDGYRLIIFKKGNKVQIFTRNSNDWTTKFPKLAAEIRKISIDLIVDGEAVVLNKDQHSDFQLLQNAIKDHADNIIYYIFDILYYQNYNLMTLPLIERKQILKTIMDQYANTILRYSDHVFGSGREILKKACKLGLEGIVSKDSESHYSQKRNKSWLKSKCTKRQEFVIGGFTKSDKRKFFKSLMLGTFNKSGDLNYNGNVGTGFTQASLKEIHQLLSKYITVKCPFAKKPPGSKNAVWLKPIIVAEIEFTEWTDSNTLRHPSFKGIRKDKPAKKIIKEIPMLVETIKPKSKRG